jgi:hypothetical protein
MKMQHDHSASPVRQAEQTHTPAEMAVKCRESLAVVATDIGRRISDIAADLEAAAPELGAAAAQCCNAVATALDHANGVAARARDAIESQAFVGVPGANDNVISVLDAVNRFGTELGESTTRLAQDVGDRLDAGVTSSLGEVFERTTTAVKELLGEFDWAVARYDRPAELSRATPPVTTQENTLADEQLAEQRRAVELQATHRERVTLRQFPEPHATRDDFDREASFADGVIRGDYSEDDSTSATVGRVVGGINPVADARDISAAIKHIDEGKDSAWLDLATSAVGAVPVSGDALKVGLRTGREALEEAVHSAGREAADASADAAAKWLGRIHGREVPSVQAGHVTSRHSGLEERLAIEDADQNQLTNWVGESKGVIFEKQAVEIDGAIIDRATAMQHARVIEEAARESGREPRLTVRMVKDAPLHPGWVPSQPTADIKQAFMREQLRLISSNPDHPLRYLIDVDALFR